MSKEEKFVKNCIKFANDMAPIYGAVYCILVEECFDNGKCDYQKSCEYANKQGYKFSKIDKVPSLKHLNLEPQYFAFIPIDTPTTA